MRRILLAETHDHLRGLLRARFVREGFVVDEARDAETALRLAGAQRPDLIVVSDALVDEAGEALWRRMANDPELHDIPRILLSTRGAPSAEEESEESVARLEHPFRPTQLMLLARGALRASRS